MICTTLDANTILDRPGLAKSLGLSQRCISREIRHKRLRCFVRARRQWFLGKDVLAWLEAGEYRPDDLDQQDEIDGVA